MNMNRRQALTAMGLCVAGAPECTAGVEPGWKVAGFDFATEVRHGDDVGPQQIAIPVVEGVERVLSADHFRFVGRVDGLSVFEVY